MKILFQTIRSLCAGVAGTKWVDKDYKQIDIYDPTGAPAVDFPCTLIKISVVLTETLAGKTQLCTGQVTLRHADNLSVRETSANASQTASDRSLAYEDRTDALYNLLQGYTDGVIKSFDRISEADEDRKDNLSVKRMVFNFTYLQGTN